MSSTTGGPNSSFQDRLNRVAEARAPIEAAKPKVDLIPDWKTNIRYPLSLIVAALLGMAAVFLARYARFHLSGGTLAGEDADLTMMLDAGLAAGASFLLFGLLRFDGADYKMAQSVGIAIMVCVMHNFVHVAPSVFDAVFAPEWTEDVIAFTEPKSILFRGISFVLDPKAAAQAGDPQVASW